MTLVKTWIHCALCSWRSPGNLRELPPLIHTILKHPKKFTEAVGKHPEQALAEYRTHYNNINDEEWAFLIELCTTDEDVEAFLIARGMLVKGSIKEN